MAPRRLRFPLVLMPKGEAIRRGVEPRRLVHLFRERQKPGTDRQLLPSARKERLNDEDVLGGTPWLGILYWGERAHVQPSGSDSLTTALIGLIN